MYGRRKYVRGIEWVCDGSQGGGGGGSVGRGVGLGWGDEQRQRQWSVCVRRVDDIELECGRCCECGERCRVVIVIGRCDDPFWECDVVGCERVACVQQRYGVVRFVGLSVRGQRSGICWLERRCCCGRWIDCVPYNHLTLPTHLRS